MEVLNQPDVFSLAEHPNGYSFVLDARGYLHCFERDVASSVTVTFMLTTGKLTGWCSRHGSFGLEEMVHDESGYRDRYPESLLIMWRDHKNA